MKKLLGSLVCLAALFGVLAFRTARFTSRQPPAERPVRLAVDAGLVAAHLAGAVQRPTVSYEEPGRTDGAAFLSLHQYLADTYPHVATTLTREVVLFYPLLGAVTGLVSALFIWCFFRSEDWAARLPLPRAALPWIGGAIVGALVYLSHGILVGYGHLAVHLEVFGQMAWYFLLLLALGKILATSITLTSGGSGGLFTPSLYIGAAMGGAFGAALRELFPTLHIHPEAYALVGMGALVAGATNAPITGILIVFEMTNDYAIVLPLMLTTVICHLIARRLEPDSLYSGWLRRRGERIEHGSDRVLLTGLTVREAYDPAPQVFRADAPRRTCHHEGELGSFAPQEVDGLAVPARKV
jgi:hypothetical protein